MAAMTKNKRLMLSAALLLVLSIFGGWCYTEFMGPANRPFALIKDWRHNDLEFVDFSEGAQWVHHQCHEPMFTGSTLGNPLPLAAKEIVQKNAKTWDVTIQPKARFSDGSDVLAEHYENAWKFRKESIKAPLFQQIDSIKALTPKQFEVTLKDFSNSTIVLQTLSSMWITPLKLAKGKWSWDTEVSGPCEGPFVPSITAFDTLTMKRNKYWHDFDQSLLRRVSVLAGLGSRETAAKLFEEGKVSYVDATIDPDLKADFSGKNNSFLEPKAWYLLINQNGLFSKKLTAFPHHVVNRGELESAVSGGHFLRIMYGLLPLSFVDSDGKAMYGSFLQSAPESLLEARRDLGISDNALMKDVKPPFKRPVRIYCPNDPKISAVLERFRSRLKTNLNIDSEVIQDLAADSPLIDLAFVEVQLEQDLTKWAQKMLESYEKLFPMPKETKAQFVLLSKIVTQQSVLKQQAGILQTLDQIPLTERTIVPIGQFASAFLLSADVSGVRVRGNVTQDPDISFAKWTTQSKSVKELR